MKRHFWMLALFALLLGAATLSAPPARASFGDCNSASYLALFDSRFGSSPGFLCVESDRVAVHSDAGTTHIRIAQHLLSDWATRPGAVRAIKDGVDGAVSAMTRLGHYRIADVTILLVDGFGPGAGSESFGEIAAWTSFESADECRITVWLLGPGATSENGAAMIAHELFHCIEGASLTSAQTHTSGGGVAGGGTWWIEGAADWFSTVAVRAPAYMATRVSQFDANSPTMALNQMSYDAYVFFAWLGGSAHGPGSIMPFLQNMASSSAESAQRTAMAGAMPGADWLKFAEDYMDQNIRDGQGASIGSTPQPGDTIEWGDTRTERIAYAPFTVVRRNLALRCGRWSMAPRPSQYHAGKPASGGAWADLPSDLDNMHNDHGDFRFVAMNTTSTAAPLQLAMTRTAACTECGGSRELDRCMIGTWEMTTDGAEQWMREHLRSFHPTGVSAVGNTMTLRADGTFTTGSAHTEASGTVGGASGQAYLNAQASGRWSTSDGRLNICSDASTAAGEVTVTQHGHSVTLPTAPHMPAVASNAYTCAGATFTHTIPMGGQGAVTSTYNRIH